MKPRVLAVMLFIFLNGCAFHSEPKDNQEFYKISQLSELAGVYKNKGDPSGYLSAIIWGYTKLNINPEVSHVDIEFIEVLSTENSLIVKAIKNGCAIYEKPYILGRDFNISGGKIIIHRDAFLLSRGAGDVLAGPSYEQITLGLDTGKHGKYRRSDYAAGLVFLLLPIAFSETNDTRFERVNDSPQGFKACNR
ncbi:hypothetical protein [Sulfuricaulis sp.]|jgi:hypothetical protein|uniref:hypothetical protein n=1 Tax=Sulfuricaulis sp. TaxID=2003553 RepID=UPI003559AE29